MWFITYKLTPWQYTKFALAPLFLFVKFLQKSNICRVILKEVAEQSARITRLKQQQLLADWLTCYSYGAKIQYELKLFLMLLEKKNMKYLPEK